MALNGKKRMFPCPVCTEPREVRETHVDTYLVKASSSAYWACKPHTPKLSRNGLFLVTSWWRVFIATWVHFPRCGVLAQLHHNHRLGLNRARTRNCSPWPRRKKAENGLWP